MATQPVRGAARKPAVPVMWQPIHKTKPRLVLRGSHEGQDVAVKIWVSNQKGQDITPWLLEISCGEKTFLAHALRAEASDLIVHVFETSEDKNTVHEKHIGQGSLSAWASGTQGPIMYAVSHPTEYSFELRFRVPVEGLPDRVSLNN